MRTKSKGPAQSAKPTTNGSAVPVQMRPLGEMFVKDDDPIVYRGLPVWYRDLTRGTLRVYRSGYQQKEGNRHCRKAMWQALGYRYRRQPSNWEGCHIWTTDSRSNRIVVDPDYYTCLANLVALPKETGAVLRPRSRDQVHAEDVRLLSLRVVLSSRRG